MIIAKKKKIKKSLLLNSCIKNTLKRLKKSKLIKCKKISVKKDYKLKQEFDNSIHLTDDMLNQLKLKINDYELFFEKLRDYEVIVLQVKKA